MKGRRIEKRASGRNPLFKIFIALCIAVLALAVTAVMLGVRLSTVNKELALAQSRLEQYEPKSDDDPADIAQGETQEDEHLPDKDKAAEQNAPDTAEQNGTQTNPGTVPEVKPDTKPETKEETETKVGWLDLTGHGEVKVAPKSVFDKYYTYYATDGVNLRGGPGTSYDRIALIEFGAEVEAAAKDGNWTFVHVAGKYGWISADYLSTTKPEPVKETQTAEQPKNTDSEKTNAPQAQSEKSETPENTAERTQGTAGEYQEIPAWLLE